MTHPFVGGHARTVRSEPSPSGRPVGSRDGASAGATQTDVELALRDVSKRTRVVDCPPPCLKGQRGALLTWQVSDHTCRSPPASTFPSVFSGHGGIQRFPDGPASGARTFRWRKRLAMVTLALGLVVMHHLVGVHQHSGVASTVPLPVPTEGSYGEEARDLGAAVALAPGTGPAVSVDSAPAESAALLHQHRDGDDHSPLMVLLHACLAVLASISALLVRALAASWWRAFADLFPDSSRATVVLVARAPPAPLRLAQLQILRL